MARKRLPEPMLTLDEVATFLNISYSKAYRLAKEGEILGAMRVGAEWRFDRAVFTAWLKSQLNGT